MPARRKPANRRSKETCASGAYAIADVISKEKRMKTHEGYRATARGLLTWTVAPSRPVIAYSAAVYTDHHHYNHHNNQLWGQRPRRPHQALIYRLVSAASERLIVFPVCGVCSLFIISKKVTCGQQTALAHTQWHCGTTEHCFRQRP